MERITKRMIDQPGRVGCAHINDAVCIDRSGSNITGVSCKFMLI